MGSSGERMFCGLFPSVSQDLVETPAARPASSHWILGAPPCSVGAQPLLQGPLRTEPTVVAPEGSWPALLPLGGLSQRACEELNLPPSNLCTLVWGCHSPPEGAPSPCLQGYQAVIPRPAGGAFSYFVPRLPVYQALVSLPLVYRPCSFVYANSLSEGEAHLPDRVPEGVKRSYFCTSVDRESDQKVVPGRM